MKIINELINKSKKLNYRAFFWWTIILIAFIYNYNHTVFHRPAGIHQWRNCVSAGYALGLYHDCKVLEPTFGAYMTNNRTSQVVQLECPILYYFVSRLYATFGYHEFLYRLTNIIFGFFGLFSLYKLSRYLLKDNIYSLFISLIIFTSVIFIFYINNFITDGTGLAFALMGLHQFYRYVITKKNYYFLISMLFASIAGLLKIQSLMIYFSVFGMFLLEGIFRVKLQASNEKIFKDKLVVILGLLSVLLIIFSWYYYAKSYTSQNNGFTSIRFTRSAIWNTSSDDIASIWDLFVRRFKAGYFHSKLFIYTTFLVLIHNIIFYKKHSKILNLFILSVFIQGIVLFNLFFFFSIGRCDYYQINNLIFISLLFLNLFLYLKNTYPHVYNSIYTKIVVLAITVLLVGNGAKAINKKYSDWFYYDTMKIVRNCGDIKPYLRNLGIQRNDRVYYTPDISMNISLYLMDQVGNTDFGRLPNKKDYIEELKSKGCKYLIVGTKKELQNPELSDYVTSDKLIGKFNDVRIFKLQ